MTIEQIREELMTNENFLAAEMDMLCTYYKLKHTPRWAHIRTQDEVESVAEHIYGMHILADYFIPLLDETFDLEKVRHIITWHDMAEAIVGDMTSRSKTDEHKQAEKRAEQDLIVTAPSHLKERLQFVYETFDTKTAAEAKLVKALDKIEPMFHLYFLSKNVKNIHKKFDLVWTSEVYREYRSSHINAFPLLKHVDDYLVKQTKQFHPTY